MNQDLRRSIQHLVRTLEKKWLKNAREKKLLIDARAMLAANFTDGQIAAAANELRAELTNKTHAAALEGK